MPSIHDSTLSKEESVLRRARIAKMTRALQDRLALANIKFQHGWQHRNLDSIEPELEFELKRKRPNSNGELFSDTSSTTSTRNMMPSSSPITDHPIYSDDLMYNLRSASTHSSKRLKAAPSFHRHLSDMDASFKSARPLRPAARTWKSEYALAQSSPIKKHHDRSRPSMSAIAEISFRSEADTILDRSPSEDDDEDLPIHSFQMPSAAANIASSPPRTPPPDVARSARLRNKTFDNNDDTPVNDSFNGGKEGADLLLYLAASPSPAVTTTRGRNVDVIPSTPPSKHTPLPSSMMTTPGTANFLGFNLATPGPGFNFSDFVNVTPSPAQATFAKTPTAAKTPRAALEARRRLNFDALSPQSSRRESRGLGMELGGELLH